MLEKKKKVLQEWLHIELYKTANKMGFVKKL